MPRPHSNPDLHGATSAIPARIAKSGTALIEKVRQTAYAYYEARGRVDGHDLDDWLRAEAHVNAAPAAKRPRAASASG
ncbi:MAG: DUF2934 domain-containing protein [Rhizobacter sp.]|nr:DUF2934 domain-containing protein [Rhizobacter sp.]